MTEVAFGPVSFADLRKSPLRDVQVAVVDSGVDATHPYLATQVIRSVRYETGAFVDADRNNDLSGHGTGVAGVVVQTASNARIVDIRILSDKVTGSGEALLAALDWIGRDPNIEIINLSMSCPAAFRERLHRACEALYRANRIVVSSSRNYPQLPGTPDRNGLPAEFSTCISVEQGPVPLPDAITFLHGSPRDAMEGIEFRANGTRRVFARGGGFADNQGSSFATPYVTGLVALLRGAMGPLRSFEVKSLLKASATPAERVRSGFL